MNDNQRFSIVVLDIRKWCVNSSGKLDGMIRSKMFIAMKISTHKCTYRWKMKMSSSFSVIENSSSRISSNNNNWSASATAILQLLRPEVLGTKLRSKAVPTYSYVSHRYGSAKKKAKKKMLAITFWEKLSIADTVFIVCERICKLKHSVCEKQNPTNSNKAGGREFEPHRGRRFFLSLSVWAHFLSWANAQKVLFGIFIRALWLITFEPIYNSKPVGKCRGNKSVHINQLRICKLWTGCQCLVYWNESIELLLIVNIYAVRTLSEMVFNCWIVFLLFNMFRFWQWAGTECLAEQWNTCYK